MYTKLNSSEKPRAVEIYKDKDKSVIKKKAYKQTKEEASLEQAKSITSSNSTKKSEQKKRKKEAFSSDKNEVYTVKKKVAVCTFKKYNGIYQCCLLFCTYCRKERKSDCDRKNGEGNWRSRKRRIDKENLT